MTCKMAIELNALGSFSDVELEIVSEAQVFRIPMRASVVDDKGACRPHLTKLHSVSVHIGELPGWGASVSLWEIWTYVFCVEIRTKYGHKY